MNKLFRFSRILSEKIVLFSSLMLLVSVITILALVFSRYLFSYSFPWAEELTRYLVVYFALLSCASLVYDREHISVSYFFEHLPAKVRYFIRLFFDVCIFLTMVVWVVVGFDTALFMKGMWSGGIGITMFWPYMAIPISGFFLCFFILLNFFNDLTHSDWSKHSMTNKDFQNGENI